MACNKGYQGDCCCECDNQIALKNNRVKTKNGFKHIGYACIAFRESSPHIKDRFVGYVMDKHGACELFVPKELPHPTTKGVK